MFRLSSNHIMVVLSVLICMNICGIQNGPVTKELYRKHYKPFEEYVLEKRTMVNMRKIPLIGEGLVKEVARATGYDDFAVQCIPFMYSLCDRPENDLKNVLRTIESDECIGHANLILRKYREKPGDLNRIVRVTHEEGKRLEQEKMKKSGQAASTQEKDTFIAIGLLVRYLVKNKYLE